MTLNLIPMPNNIQIKSGSFVLRNGLRISASEVVKSKAVMLKSLVGNFGKVDLEISDERETSNFSWLRQIFSQMKVIVYR